MRDHEGLEPMAALLKTTDNTELLSAVTGAVWKCSKSPKNVAKSVRYNSRHLIFMHHAQECMSH